MFASLILSECVYKAVDSGPTAALRAVETFQAQFPPGSVEISTVQFCRQRVTHRYLLASGGGALYVAFMGTKELRDVLADMALGPRAVWSSESTTSGTEGESWTATAAAHGGFLSRAEGIPAEALLLHALRKGMRLVLCG